MAKLTEAQRAALLELYEWYVPVLPFVIEVRNSTYRALARMNLVDISGPSFDPRLSLTAKGRTLLAEKRGRE